MERNVALRNSEREDTLMGSRRNSAVSERLGLSVLSAIDIHRRAVEIRTAPRLHLRNKENSGAILLVELRVVQAEDSTLHALTNNRNVKALLVRHVFNILHRVVKLDWLAPNASVLQRRVQADLMLFLFDIPEL